MFLNSRAKFERCDVVINPPELHRFGMFDTKNHTQIERIGYDAACASMPDLERALAQADKA